MLDLQERGSFLRADIDSNALQIGDSSEDLLFHGRDSFERLGFFLRELGPIMGQAPDVGELEVDDSGQGKRVELAAEVLESLDCLWVDKRIRGGESGEAVERGLGPIIDPTQAGTLSDNLDQFDRGLEEIHVQPQLVGVKIVHGLDGFRGIVAVPTDEFADMGPVFLLDMGVVVFFVGPAAGEVDLAIRTVFFDMVVDELAAVVDVQPSEGKGEPQAHLFQSVHDASLSFPQNGPAFGPGGDDVGQVESVEELALAAASAVRDQVHLDPAGLVDIGKLSPQRNLVPQQCSGFGPAIEPPFHGRLLIPEPAIDGAGADPQKLFLLLKRETVAGPDPGQPEAKNLLQPDRPGIAGRLPYGQHHLQDSPPIELVLVAFSLDHAPFEPAPMDLPDRIFSIQTAHLTELIKDPAFFLLCRSQVPFLNRLNITHSKLPSHDLTSLPRKSGYHDSQNIPPFSVRFLYDKIYSPMVRF